MKGMKKTVNMVSGIVGLSVGSSLGAGLGGPTGAIINQGALPMAATGMLAESAQMPRRWRKKRKWR